MIEKHIVAKIALLAIVASACIDLEDLPDRPDSAADADSDSDADADECTSGVCCNATTKSFHPSTFQCDSWTEYRCDGIGCGANAQQRTVTRYCSGSSSDCSGNASEDSWTTIASCENDQPCETDDTSYAECGVGISASGCECFGSGNWYDSASGLCWQNPPSTTGMNWHKATGTANDGWNPGGATDYCGDLDQGGFDDWRVPDIDELISLMRGCVSGSATGDLSQSACGVEDPGCLQEACAEGDDCDLCSVGGGPGEVGCYWDPAVSGYCVYYWSSSLFAGFNAWHVDFNDGSVACAFVDIAHVVRCVRL